MDLVESGTDHSARLCWVCCRIYVVILRATNICISSLELEDGSIWHGSLVVGARKRYEETFLPTILLEFTVNHFPEHTCLLKLFN